MNNITLSNYIDFFRRLDLKQKVAILKELTNEISEVVDKREGGRPVNSEQNQDFLIDELFGVWKDEDDLSEESIINRTLPDRVIDFD